MPKQPTTLHKLPTRQTFTAECVSPKHPDKLCDQISDAVLDAYLKEDPHSRVAVDVAGGHGVIFVTGEITSKAKNIDIKKIVHRLVGVGDSQTKTSDFKVIISIKSQSKEIAQGVDNGGAGDQGIMIGYACNETPDLLPLEYVLARNLNQYLYNIWPYDGKTQITTRGGLIDTVVASFQRAPTHQLKLAVYAWLSSEPLVDTSKIQPKFHINPAGDWNVGGFDADAGLTGRKLAVDNYGPRVPLGGGAFSGKDGTKVDRSGAYMARKIAVDYLKRRKAKEVYVYLAYAIGFDQPVEATVVIDGQEELIKGYDLSPKGIITSLNLTNPQFEHLATYGHFK